LISLTFTTLTEADFQIRLHSYINSNTNQ